MSYDDATQPKESEKNQGFDNLNNEEKPQKGTTNKNDLGCVSSKKRHIKLCGISDTRVRKRQLFAVIIYLFLLWVAVALIETFIEKKYDRLLSDMKEEMYRPFNNLEEESAEGLSYKNLEDLEFIEVPIPPLKLYQNEANSQIKSLNNAKKRYWTNMFSGIEHLYKIIYGGWRMMGMKYSLVDPQNRNLSSYGIIDYGYEPYMICVPNGIEFNSQIAKAIIEQSLEIEYRRPEEYDSIDNLLPPHSNDYFECVCEFNGNDSVPKLSIPFENQLTGTDPIFDENERFTGYYWFGMHVIGPYRVLFGYKNYRTTYVTEKDGFDASLRDRVLSYSTFFLILTSALALFLFRTSRKLKTSRRLLTEPLRERLLRYADPIKHMNAADSLKVAAARDISEKLLDTSIDDFQVEEIADELREKLRINLITEQEKSYLIDLCKSFIKKGKKQLETQKLVNNLFVLITDTSKVGGKDYTEIQRTITQISDLNKR